MTKCNRQARRAWAAACRKHIRPGNFYRVEFQHDAACLIYSRETLCNCNCDRVLMDDAGRMLARVEGAGFYDPFELVEALA
jgi:hypothetical protein